VPAIARFNPVNPFWYEDLPDAAAPFGETIQSPTLDDDINAINDQYLEMSRAANVMRGGLLLMGLVLIAMLCWSLPLLVRISFRHDSVLFLSIVNWALVAVAIVCGIFLIMLDCLIPKDLPVRFDRGTGSVTALDYPIRFLPFPPRRLQLKHFAWSDVHAEITRQAGYNGKAYVVRYALVLVICKSGTTEVLDRLVLKSNDMTVKGLHAMWDYVRRYMREGTVNLPPVQTRAQGISFRRSLFTYMPYLDPSSEGAYFRARMGAIDWITAFFMTWFFWIWIPMGLCHFIAMKCAPEPQWPEKVPSFRGNG